MDFDALKRQYFTEYIRAGFRDIFKAQREIAYRKTFYAGESSAKSRSARLREALEGVSVQITPSGSGIKATVEYPLFIRFLDMKHIGNYRIYNRPVWGILYRETLRDIRYEFSGWLQKNFGEELAKAFQQS